MEQWLAFGVDECQSSETVVTHGQVLKEEASDRCQCIVAVVPPG